MQAIVMAGGEGSRLRPLTTNRPKPLVPVGNKPIMEYILNLLAQHGIQDVVATLHYLADEIRSYFDDGSDYNVKLSYSIEDIPVGTAGSVKRAEGFLKDGPYLIISGDALTDCDLTKAYEFHKSHGAIATVILYRVSNPLEYGMVTQDENGRILRFLEKPSWSEVFSDTVNTGMYILEPEILELMERGKFYDWSQDIFPMLLQAGKPIYGYVMDEYWCDIGTLNQYYEAQEAVLSEKTNLRPAGEEVRPGIWVGQNCVIDEEATLIPPVCLGRGCKIKKNVKIGPYTIIADNALIEESAQIEHSIIWDSPYIGHNVKIFGAMLCTRITLKRDVSVQENVVIGDRCLVDVGSTLRSGIKLWPDKIIERGSTVTMSLIWGNKWRGSLFRNLGIAGISNIEIAPDFAVRLGSAFGSILENQVNVVATRDSTRSSRMIKRAMIASLLSVGCNILDMRNTAPAVARYSIRSTNAAGGISVRKFPDNSRLTLIELFDSDGAYLSKSLERKVETTFFREDFNRTDPDDLGVIEYAGRAIDEYQSGFFKHIQPSATGKRLRIVCDYGHSSISYVFPSMLGKMHVESISLNSFNDAKLAPRSKADINNHLESLGQIVNILGYDFGVLFLDEGERLVLVDRQGKVIRGNSLLATVSLLLSKVHPNPKIALSITAPQRLEDLIVQHHGEVIRTKADPRSLTNTGFHQNADLIGDYNGGFILPFFHPGFDAMAVLGKLIAMIQDLNCDLSDIHSEIPEFHMEYEQALCPWEYKGTVMRRLSEEYQGHPRAELLDGIKIFDGHSWMLAIPDETEPLFHVYAESSSKKESESLAQTLVHKIRKIVEQS